MIEVHDRPDEALSDGNQALLPEQFEQLMAEVRLVANALSRPVSSPLEQQRL